MRPYNGCRGTTALQKSSCRLYQQEDFRLFQLVITSPFSIFLKSLQRNAFPIKHRISEIVNPIPHDGCQSVLSSLVLHGLVLVAEDKEIDGRVKLCLLLGVLVEAGVRDVIIIASLHLILEFLQAVVVRPFQR